MPQSQIYPPVLDAKAMGFPFLKNNPEETYYEIIFAMPSFNAGSEIGHIQVTIKYKTNGSYAVNKKYSPDGATLFYRCPDQEDLTTARYFRYNSETNLYTLKIPYACFEKGYPQMGTNYLFQVRFGTENELWDDIAQDKWACTEDASFSNYPRWRSQQTNRVPSGFGEWSNVQVAYCYAGYSCNVKVNFDDFVPTIVFTYTSAVKFSDPLQQVKLIYTYYDDSVRKPMVKSQVFNSQLNQDGTYSVQFKLNLAPVAKIAASIEGVTKNNVIIGTTVNIAKAKIGQGFDFEEIAGSIEDVFLPIEELEDGCLSKKITVTETGAQTYYLNVYRSNLYTLETVKVAEMIEVAQGVPYNFKDYSCEMGERCQYIFAVVDPNSGKVTGILGQEIDDDVYYHLYPWGTMNPGYAKCDRLDSVYLTTRKHQLRLSGNVKLSSYKKNTQDQFQTVIGSPYPFYSRSSQQGYRTFSLSGLISIQFDPTSTFLRNDLVNGLWYDAEESNSSKLILLNSDLFNYEPIPRNLVRYSTGRGDYIFRDDVEAKYRGPQTNYDNYFHRDIYRNDFSDAQSSDVIYMERQFREAVMSWLSNGKPKLFRSETEGNMIVMTSGVSFTPDDKTHRMVYNVQMTVTEIAEYNYENLLKFNLLPTDFKSARPLNFPQELSHDDIISGQDFGALAALNGEIEGVRETLILLKQNGNLVNFESNGQHSSHFSSDFDDFYKVLATGESLKQINDLINNITNLSFIRGAQELEDIEQPILLYSPNFDIPESEVGLEIAAIDYSKALYNLPPSKDYEVIWSIQGGYGLQLNGSVLSGAPIEDAEAGYAYIQCTFRNTLTDVSKSTIMPVKRGEIYKRMQASLSATQIETLISDDNYTIEAMIAGAPIRPIQIEVAGGKQEDESETSEVEEETSNE